MLSGFKFQALFVLLACITMLGCSGEPFVTPETTVAEYVEAYNDGDTKSMAVCGNDVDVRKIFVKSEENLLGERILIPIKDIKFEVISVNQRPRTTLANQFLTEDAWVEAEFTSADDSDFRRITTIRLVNRTHSYYIEAPHWQIVPLKGD
ncbi:hypothetical protein J7M28_10875 [bacterium]|nr:hypothetical protein [bacterium]